MSDVLKVKANSVISMVLDSKKIYHRDPEIDEGWYTFDVTSAVNRWLDTTSFSGQSPQILALEKGDLKVTIKNGKVLPFMPEGAFDDAYLVVYSEDHLHRDRRIKRSAKRSRNDRHRKKSKKRKGHWANCKRHSL